MAQHEPLRSDRVLYRREWPGSANFRLSLGADSPGKRRSS
jgi:hypothetical protein